MATKYDMLTNEGNLALARAVATGAKLSIRGAVLCNVTSGMSTVAEVASLKLKSLGITIDVLSEEQREYLEKVD